MVGNDPRSEVDALRKRLNGTSDQDCQVPFEADRTHLLRMSDNIRLVPSEIGEHRHLKLLRHTRRMATLSPWPTVEDFEENDEAELAGVETDEDVEVLLDEHGILGLAMDYRAGAEAIVRWINDEYQNEHTNQDYRTALRSFGRYRRKRSDPPEALDWIPTGTSNNFNPTPSERDILTWDEVSEMIDVAHNPRDKALFAVQFEAGCRSGELFDLRVGDIFDSDHTVGLHVNGKRGERSVHLIMSVPYLQEWLREHPGRDDDHLWSKLNAAARPAYPTWNGYFKSAAERAGVTKAVTPTAFRKANTRYLVRLGLSQPRIEDRQGRERGSDHTARYMARFGDESTENRYATLHGKDVESDEPDEIGPVTCPRCQRETPRNEDQCIFCGFALSHEATEDAVDTRQAGLRVMGQLAGENDIDADEAANLLDTLIDQRVQSQLEQTDAHS